jgi:ATP-dependent Clp protease adaptor protein ClpS
MAIKITTNFFVPATKTKTYLVYIISYKHVPWQFCMRVLSELFYKNYEEAERIAHDIVTEGEGLCGAYIYEIAENKARLVEELAKKEGYTLDCLIEEV